MDKTAIFIDNGYFKKVQEALSIRVDYLKFVDSIMGGDSERLRAYVYDCPPYQSTPPKPEQMEMKSHFDSFKYNITKLPRFEMRTGRLQIVKDGEGNTILKKDGTPLLKQKGVDMALGIDIARLSSTRQIQKVIIIAGDSDFIPAIITAKQEGILVTLYYHDFVHDSLYDVCDDRFQITRELLLKCKRN